MKLTTKYESEVVFQYKKLSKDLISIKKNNNIVILDPFWSFALMPQTTC